MTMKRFLIFVGLLSLAVPAWAQRGKVRRDPLTDQEVEQMREFRDMPEKRVKVLNEIIRKRADLLSAWEKDVKAVPPSERGKRTHDLLEDIVNLLDEFGDNVDTFLKEQADVRKPLRDSVAVFMALENQLHQIKSADADKPWFADFSFPLQDAIEAADRSIKDANDAIQEDERILQAKKEQEKQRNKGPVKIR